MSWRTLVISKPSQLSIKKQQLEVKQEKERITLPLEDLACLILEETRTSITGALLSDLAQRGILLLTCNASHHPNGVLHSFATHSRVSDQLTAQITASKPFNKQIWKLLVQTKITHQGQCLALTKRQGADYLLAMAKKVQSGDSGNLEATSARFYWKNLFGADFTRSRDSTNLKNAALNYGYSIIRAYVARAVVSCGLTPMLGVHHCNQLNAFNLVDDLIEPLRPLLDHWVYGMLDQPSSLPGDSLSQEQRIHLVSVAHQPCQTGAEVMQMDHAINWMVQSFCRALASKKPEDLRIPGFAKHLLHSPSDE